MIGSNPVDYLVQDLKDRGFSDIEVVEFMNLVYNNLVIYNKDLESQIVYGGNYKYIDVFHLVDDYDITNNYLIEWININSTSDNGLLDSDGFLLLDSDGFIIIDSTQ
jgi:hypothetical protein